MKICKLLTKKFYNIGPWSGPLAQGGVCQLVIVNGQSNWNKEI
jgi:hypothetical protein